MDGPELKPELRWEHPDPLGYGRGVKEVHFIAAPLLAAAALSLAGVVANAEKGTFRWPGFTLLLLVVTSMLLVATVQFGYYARKFLYSRQDILDWLPEATPKTGSKEEEILRYWQNKDYSEWRKFNNIANRLFDAGVVLIGFSVAALLAPPRQGNPSVLRLASVAIVLACTVIEVIAIVVMERSVNRRSRKREESLGTLYTNTPAQGGDQ